MREMPGPEAVDLYSRLTRAVRRSPGAPALHADGRSFTHGELARAAAALAPRLAERGLRRGDRVLLLAADSAELVAAQLAALRAGAVLVPLNPGYTRREVAHVVADAEPRLAICDAERLALWAELAPAERTSVEEVLALEGLATAALPGASEPEEGAPLAPLAADDLALLLYTSGTTGRSKGACLSHGNVVAMIESMHAAWAWSERDVLLLALPLFHLHGLVVGLMSALAAGAAVRLERRFDAAAAVDTLAAGEATLFFGVPTLYRRLAEELARRETPADFSAVRLFVSGSAPLPTELFEAFRAAAGVEILERYGMTETGMLLGNPLGGPRLPGTVGVPLPGVEARLVDPQGRPVADGEEGEIEVRGPNVFSGYFRSPEKSAASFRADPAGRSPWFRTGDLGRRDTETGHFTLLGRASELILSGGFNVYPREVEEVLLALPGVREAAVVGEPHPEFGESPVAFLVADGELAPAELEAHCRRELAPFKRPRRFVRLDALPRNALGKVEKRRLIGGEIPYNRRSP